MKIDWLLTNREVKEHPLGKFQTSNFSFYYSEGGEVYKSQDYLILIDGFILPRFKYQDIFSGKKKGELVVHLFKEHGPKLINYLKGSFNLIIIRDDNCYLFNDHIGMKKFFIHEAKEKFVISNNIHFITRTIKPELDPEGIALNSLFHHFVDCKTTFRGVTYSPPGSKYVIGSDLIKDQYWNYKKLVELERKPLSYDKFADKITRITKGYLDYIGSKNISMTLTGGMDSRTILAILLKLGYNPNTFTFGSRVSADVDVASKITNYFALKFNNHTEVNPSGEWYNNLADEIVSIGNPLIHIHRSHRLDAIKKEMEKYPDTEILFTGAMGGEGIRGLHYDSLIVTDYVKRIHEGEDLSILDSYLEKYFIKNSNIDKSKLLQNIKNLKYLSGEYKSDEFFVLYELVASLHDYQDLSIYQNYLPYVISIFLDIDYLEMLFSSNYSLFDKDNLTGNQLKRLNIPEVHCNLIDRIYKPLSKFQFVNGFSPSEFLMNRYYYLILRGLRKKFGKKYPPNFPYSDWYHDFIGKNFKTLSPELENVIDLDKAKKDFDSCDHKTVEGYWHKFTNIVMYSKHINFIKE